MTNFQNMWPEKGCPKHYYQDGFKKKKKKGKKIKNYKKREKDLTRDYNSKDSHNKK